MTVTTAAAKRGKKFKDVPAQPASAANPFVLADVAKILVCEFPWLPRSIDLTNKSAAAEFVHRRLFGASVTLGEGLTARGDEKGLKVVKRLHDGVGEVLTTWLYADVAKAIVAADPSAAESDAPIKGAMDLRDDVPDEVGRQLPKPLGRAPLSLEALERHPSNRAPLPNDIAARAQSLAADGQLEDVVVRQLQAGGKPNGRYQIISGETRVLAAASLDWTEIRCTVIECDDAEALRLVGLYNGQRTDLNPIQKAQHIEAMCAAGLTREEAGRCVGVESGSAASNLVRLLKLPKVWQDRVAAGELAESWARLILPLVPLDEALKELDGRFKQWLAGKADRWDRTFAGRQQLEGEVELLLDQYTRRLDGTKRAYGCQYNNLLGGNYELFGQYPCLLHADEIAANRAKLKILTLAIDGKEVEVATNVKLFDELQCAVIRKRHEEKAKKKAAAAGKTTGAEAKAKSPADLKRDAEQRAEHLQRSIREWLERLLRREIANAIVSAKPTKTIDLRLLKLVLYFFAEGAVDSFSFEGELHKLMGVKQDRNPLDRGSVYALLAPVGDKQNPRAVEQWQGLAAGLCCLLIGGRGGDEELLEASIERETLQALFDEWGCDLTAAWRKLFAARDPLLQEFFELHRKDELRELAKEVVPDLHLAETLGKDQMLKLILGRTRPPEVPKCLLPVKKREAGKGSGARGQGSGKRGGK